ncbi:hypothetical protein RAS2_29100 [Phycisphaerae bacterium RAS2]|nr:hypothetical protein RAS2_29100 [Phycisphaerae bacterium RAS2]
MMNASNYEFSECFIESHSGDFFPKVFRWVLVLIVLAAAPIYLAKRPDHYTPLVETLLNVLLFLLAYWIGHSQEAAKAAQRANDRWLPQAESVIFRLLTLHANVRRFSFATKSDCKQSECELPELKQDEMRAVRVKIKSECEASTRRLDDIAHQLEDAIGDWRRFIAANCVGGECARIFEAIKQREVSLLNGALITGPHDNSEAR